MESSFLFVPGHRPDRFEKALASGAHAVIVDLEDAVSPQDKDGARQSVGDWLRPDRPVWVRINAADTAWFRSDCDIVSQAGVAGVILPKAERAEDVARVAAAAAGAPVLPLIETAAGFGGLESLARVPGVQRLVFGSIDFQVDLGIDWDGEELLMFRSRLVLESRLAGLLPPVDGVSLAIDDTQALAADAHRSRRLGFGAKLCIHPRQVQAVNAAFLPSAQEIEWAQRVLEACEASQGAAVAVDGKMVDRPIMLKAQRILARIAKP